MGLSGWIPQSSSLVVWGICFPVEKRTECAPNKNNADGDGWQTDEFLGETLSEFIFLCVSLSIWLQFEVQPEGKSSRRRCLNMYRKKEDKLCIFVCQKGGLLDSIQKSNRFVIVAWNVPVLDING